LIVDCLLPGQIRKLGRRVVYQTRRRAIQTSARDCEISGGEYVSADRSTYASSLKVWLPLAQEGDPKAQTYVGEIYEKGLGNTPDYQAAAIWYQKAASNGNASAQINLGNLYEQGLGVPKDKEKAFNLYRQASGLGDEVAFIPKDELEVLKQEAEESKREVLYLKQQLYQSQEELEKTRQLLLNKNKGIELEKQNLEKTRMELEKLQDQALSATNDEELRKLRASLKKSESEREARRLQIKEKEEEVIKYKEELALSNEKSSNLSKLSHKLENKELDVVKLQEQLEANQDLIDDLRIKFDKRIKEVELASENEEEIKKLRNELAKSNKKLRKSENNLDSRTKDMHQFREKLATLKIKVEDQNEELENQNKKIVSLKSSNEEKELDGPRIVMIDPEVKLTRGVTIVNAKLDVQRNIIGKVIAPAGLMSFTFNDIDKTNNINKDGIFHLKAQVDSQTMPIKLVAVDNKGNKVQREFLLKTDLKQEHLSQNNNDINLPQMNFGNYHALIISVANFSRN